MRPHSSEDPSWLERVIAWSLPVAVKIKIARQRAEGGAMESPRHTALDEPAGTVFWFGAYIALVAAFLFTVPEFFLPIFFLPPPVDPWIRVLAVPLFNFALMYMAMARLGAARSLENDGDYTILGYRALRRPCGTRLGAADYFDLCVS